MKLKLNPMLYPTLYHLIICFSNNNVQLKQEIDKRAQLVVQNRQPVMKDGRYGIIRGISSRGVQIAFGTDGKSQLATTKIVDIHTLIIPVGIQAVLDELLPMLQLRVANSERNRQARDRASLLKVH
jgi:hypothetical protein